MDHMNGEVTVFVNLQLLDGLDDLFLVSFAHILFQSPTKLPGVGGF